jgi:FeS assembly SUF system protein
MSDEPQDTTNLSLDENPAQPETPAPGSDRIAESVMATLATIYDPEIPVDITALGLIYDIAVADDGATAIRMTLTTPNCPAAEMLPSEIETKARAVDGVTSVDLQIVWDPPWSPDMMSEAAKLELGLV